MMPPDVRHRQRDEFCKSAGAVYSNAFCVRTEMAAAREAISAAAANHMPFPANNLANVKIGDVGAGLHYFTNELMTNHHGHRNGFPRPFIPFENVNVGAANSGAVNANQHVVDADGGLRNIFQPQSRLALALGQRLHWFNVSSECLISLE